MHKRETFRSGRPFTETAQYLQAAFFPRLKEAGVGALIQLLPPRITVNEPRRFGMTRLLEKRMFLTVEVEEDAAGNALVTVMSTLRIEVYFISGIIFTLLTCGVAALLFIPITLIKYNRWTQYVQKTVALLKSDLGSL